MLHLLRNILVPAVFLAALPMLHAEVAPDAVLTQVITEKSLSLRYNIEAAEAAIDACAANHVRLTVVIVDALGNVKLQMVGDGGNYNLLDEARRKARTAASMRQSTTALLKAQAANPKMLIPPDLDFLVVPGGAPFRAGPEVVGAIGVAGGDPAAAESCAQAGVDKLKESLHPEEPHGNGPEPNTRSGGLAK